MRKTETLIKISITLSAIGVLFMVWYFANADIITLIKKDSFDTLGQIGDLLGGFIGTIFALIATILLIATLNTQREANKKNSNFLSSQQFENSFISLLNILSEQIKSIEHQSTRGAITGKKYFQHCQKLVTRFYNTDIDRNSRLNNVINTYEIFYVRHRNSLGSYYRLLYRIFDFIDSSNLTDNRKYHYAKILRATLSESELFLLHYNSLTGHGKNFRELILKYNILKHLPFSSHIELKEFYEDLNSSEFANFKFITDEIGISIKNSISKTIHIEVPIKFSNLKINTINLKNGIRIDISVLNEKKYKATFFENLNYEKKITYLQDLLWEICIFSNYGSFVSSLETISYNKQTLNNDSETTFRCEMIFPLEQKLNIQVDKL